MDLGEVETDAAGWSFIVKYGNKRWNRYFNIVLSKAEVSLLHLILNIYNKFLKKQCISHLSLIQCLLRRKLLLDGLSDCFQILNGMELVFVTVRDTIYVAWLTSLAGLLYIVYLSIMTFSSTLFQLFQPENYSLFQCNRS